MTATSARGARATGAARTRRVRVGMLGQFGSGNIGNNASMEAVLAYLRAAHPDADLDIMCGGPEDVRERYKVSAVPMMWDTASNASGVAAIPLKVLGKGIECWRIVTWTRRHDAVIIPGMGVLEATLPVPFWTGPLRHYLVSLAGRLFGTKVGYVSVGASVVAQPVTRWLFSQSVRLADYCSCRDSRSQGVLKSWGIDVASIPVYPDLAFALSGPPRQAGDPNLVCVGVMDYYGGDADRTRSAIRTAYVAEMMRFVRWLLEEGKDVCLLVGDTNGSDQTVVDEILGGIGQSMPGLADGRLTEKQVIGIDDVQAAMAPAGTVVATRFHNVVASFMLGKPTIAISYGAKHDSLMADWGMAEYCLPLKTLDHEELARRFTRLADQAPQLWQELGERKAAAEQLLADQFKLVSDTLLPPGE
jgi:polysaccharide pyruvyl transferase WcaK-like protein